jgi:hypothetical protein
MSKEHLAFATMMMAVMLAAVTIVAAVSIMPSANADSSNVQTFDKALKKCEKAVEDDNQKKADQAGDQATRHLEGGGVIICRL